MRRAFVLVAAVVLAGPAAAQERTGPAVEVRLKSVEALLDHFEYLGGIAGQEEQAKQGVGLVRAFAGEKGIAGVDPKRPFGVYATVTKDVADSVVVAMVPIADEEAFLGLLKGQLSLNPKKGDDGVYEVDVPNVPQTVYFTFAKGYAFATVRDKKPLAGKELADPKAFFAGEDPAVLSVAVHIDRLPAEVRKVVFGQFEMQLQKEKAKKNGGDTAAQHKLKGLLLDGIASAANTLLTDGKTLTARLLIAPKKDELALDVTLTAAAGSDLADALRSVAGRKGLAPVAARVADPVFAAAANFGLPPALVERLGPVVDDLIKEAIAAAKPDDRLGAEKVFGALRPTLKAGQVEAGLAMTGPGEGKYRVVAAVRTKEGAGIEKTARELAPYLPGEKVKVEFAAAKAGDMTLHKITTPNPETKKAFGTEHAWAVTGDDLFVLSFEPDAAEAKRVAGGSPVGGDVLRVEMAAAAFTQAFNEQLPKEKVAELVTEVYGGKPAAGADALRLTVSGGEKLTVSATAKGKALRLLAAVDQARKKQ